MRLKFNFAIQQVTDFWAAVPVGQDAKRYQGVISLNETSKDIMQLLANDITQDELIAKMQELYDVSEEQLQADVEQFLNQLREANLLV